MGVPSRTSARTPALDQTNWDFQIILGKVRPFTSPGRGSSTGSDHCSRTGWDRSYSSRQIALGRRYMHHGLPTAEARILNSANAMYRGCPSQRICLEYDFLPRRRWWCRRYLVVLLKFKEDNQVWRSARQAVREGSEGLLPWRRHHQIASEFSWR